MSRRRADFFFAIFCAHFFYAIFCTIFFVQIFVHGGSFVRIFVRRFFCAQISVRILTRMFFEDFSDTNQRLQTGRLEHPWNVPELKLVVVL